MAIHDPHSFSDTAQGAIDHITFSLAPDLATRRVHGRAEYTMDRPVTGALDLDSKGLDIHTIEAGGSPLRWSLDRDDPILGQRLHLSDLQGLQRFTIRCTTAPGAAALQWLDPAQTAGGAQPFFYTQCQACNARSLFPCQDSPSVRFTYDAELVVPAPLSAVMAAQPLGSSSGGAEVAFRFRMPQPIPSYLFAFAVGNLAFQEIGSRTGVYAEPEIVQQAAWEFAGNEDRLRAGEALFGPYLWERYDLLIMPPAFPYGGMENPRLTFLNSVYVQGDRSGTWLVAHELAHAWTGNLVTNATWDDFWLNEGPTTYAESRISEAVEGFETAELRAAGRALRLQRAVERLGPTSPMTRLKLSLAGRSPDESYSDIAYYKGLFLLRALEREAGRAEFDAFLRDYISAFQFRSIDSDQFLAFLEDRLPQASRACNVRRWVYAPGLPEGAVQVCSALRDDVQAVFDEYRQGRRPAPERVGGWTRVQQVVFLGLLLPAIPAPDCAYFEDLFGIRATRDGELLSRFCELAFRSGYRDVLPAYETFFASVGRVLFHEPAFRALADQPWSRPLARPLLERYRHRHHPNTIAAIERILTEAGL